MCEYLKDALFMDYTSVQRKKMFELYVVANSGYV